MREIDDKTNALSSLVIGAAIEVHRTIGPGYTEGVYEEALAIELEIRRIPFRRQYGFQINYKGKVVGTGRVDLLVDDLLVVELKSVEAIQAVHRSQVFSYLKATGTELGLILNFRTTTMKDGIERVVRSVLP